MLLVSRMAARYRGLKSTRSGIARAWNRHIVLHMADRFDPFEAVLERLKRMDFNGHEADAESCGQQAGEEKAAVSD